MARNGRSFSPEFKREAASLVLDHGYTLTAACSALDVGPTALPRWVRLRKLGYQNVKLLCSDGTLGCGSTLPVTFAGKTAGGI